MTRRNEQGFTLTELILIIVILGVLSLVAIPRLGSLSAYDLRQAGQELVEAIRYAQAQSMTHTGATPFQISILSNGYRVTQGGADITHPVTGAAAYTQDADQWSGISLSATGSIAFDGRGKPSCAGFAACSTPAESNVALSLSKGGESVNLSIERYTGYARLD